ncbi:hypothetical protein VN97_g7896 [Penicillium thymicola]|uniref:Uncharacterized protein n=1 Tax=Penicillium thymicola TaxID=293382 RepID=A0AAI9TDQ2_PENTH|nr:hypothetical protein VN97_g7896 [Penicillium thymicola]
MGSLRRALAVVGLLVVVTALADLALAGFRKSYVPGKDVEKMRVPSVESAFECGRPRCEVGFTGKGGNEL